MRDDITRMWWSQHMIHTMMYMYASIVMPVVNIPLPLGSEEVQSLGGMHYISYCYRLRVHCSPVNWVFCNHMVTMP